MVAEVVRSQAQAIRDTGLQSDLVVEVLAASTAAEVFHTAAAAVVGMRFDQNSHQAPAIACFAVFLAGAVLGTWIVEVARQGMAFAMEDHRRRQQRVSRQEA